SNRYITDRFLPDKAIDLVDEAAARLKMQVDSKPEALDTLDREIVRLKIEQEALKKESDTASKDRLKTLQKKLTQLEERSKNLSARWEAEKNKLGSAAELKKRLDDERSKRDRLVAELKSGVAFAREGEAAYTRAAEFDRKIKEHEEQLALTERYDG